MSVYPRIIQKFSYISFSVYFQSQQFHNKLNEILDMIATESDSTNDTSSQPTEDLEQSAPAFEMQFPDLFVY